MDIFEELTERNLISQGTNLINIKKLINNGKAIFYIGFDPTADSLHAGSLIMLLIIKHLLKKNNKAIVLLGGGTGFIGDPTFKNKMRKMLTTKEIIYNCKKIKQQIKKILNNDNVQFINNVKWLKKLNYIDFMHEIGQHFIVNNMLHAECYKQRINNGLTFLEFSYMLMQAYDFYYLNKKYNCNLQIGGSDQWNNILAGIKLINKKNHKTVEALTINLLLNKNNEKMGKTVNGAIWLDIKKTSLYDFYQYWRNINDEDTINFLKMLTFIPIKTIQQHEQNYHKNKLIINKLKELLAYEITKFVHGEKMAIKIRKIVNNLFKNNNIDDNMPKKIIDINNDINILNCLVLSKICNSKSEAKRLIKQNGLMINNKKINDINYIISLSTLKEGIKIKKGKKTFLKVIVR